jgi:methyl-accepting chemotaxis protein
MSSLSPTAPGLAARAAETAEPENGGFFSYHGIWSPGIRLFRNINFRSKALIISAVFLLPIGLLGWNYFTAQAANIEFSSKERVGIVYAREAFPLLRMLQDERRLALLAAAKAGAGGSVEAAAQPAAELQAQLQKLAAVQTSLGSDLGTASTYKAFLESLRVLPVGTAVDAVYVAHSARVQALLNLLGAATDGSNLTLDPDIDTYYLMDAALFRLPVMMEAAAQVRGLGAAALTANAATASTNRAVIEQVTLMNSNREALEAGLGKAMAYNPEVKKHAKLEAMSAVLAAYSKQIEATVLRPEGLQGDPAAHVSTANLALDEMTKLFNSSLAELDVLIAARVDRYTFSRNLCLGVSTTALLLALYLFIAFRRVLQGGMNEIAVHINAMRDGDLTTHPHALGKDEAAVLMVSLAEMQASLRRIVSQMRGASDGIVSASVQISGGAADLSSRTTVSAANLESTASAMEEIAATVRSNEATVSEVARLACSNAAAAQSGGEIIGQVVQTMESINQSSKRIGDIIGTIDGIAFQTNILALNAAVEAARAGEQGRGFAVVASEVRALAQRSAAAAREIKGLITTSVEQVEGGTRVVKEAGSSINAMVVSANRVRELLEEVAVGAREQTQGVAQSAQSVTELDAVTQQNATLVRETAAAADNLKTQADGLALEVAQFKLPA